MRSGSEHDPLYRAPWPSGNEGAGSGGNAVKTWADVRAVGDIDAGAGSLLLSLEVIAPTGNEYRP